MERYIKFSDLVKLEKQLSVEYPHFESFLFKSLKDEFGNSHGFSVYGIRKGRKEVTPSLDLTYSDIRYKVTNKVTPVYDKADICAGD